MTVFSSKILFQLKKTRKAAPIVCLASLCMTGCDLSTVPTRGDKCNPIEFVQTEQGNQICRRAKDHLEDLCKDEYWDTIREFKSCPDDFPICASNSEDKKICRKPCSEPGYMLCGWECVNPKSDEHCGADANNVCGTDCKKDNHVCNPDTLECEKRTGDEQENIKEPGKDDVGDDDQKPQETTNNPNDNIKDQDNDKDPSEEDEQKPDDTDVLKCNEDGFVEIEVPTYQSGAQAEIEKVKAYCINNKDEFLAMRDYINSNTEKNGYSGNSETKNKDNAYVLMENIELDTVQDWIPIGTKDHPFKGYMVGNGHTISADLTAKGNNIGLFGVVEEGAIVNIDMDIDLTIDFPLDGNLSDYENNHINSGLLVGKIKESVVEKITMSGKHTLKCSSHCGGLVGNAEKVIIKDINISRLFIKHLKNCIGGIVGDGKILNISDVDITVDFSRIVDEILNSDDLQYSDLWIGGIAGYIKNDDEMVMSQNYDSKIENSNASVTFSYNTGSYTISGGAAGYVKNTEVSNVNVIFTNNANKIHHINGFVAEAVNSAFTDCAVSGNNNYLGTYGIGGFVGTSEQSIFKKCTSDIKLNLIGAWHENSSNSIEELSGAGGFVGKSQKSTYENCASKNNVIVPEDNLKDGNSLKYTNIVKCGGFAGVLKDDTITGCYSGGDVKGCLGRAGGFVGEVSGKVNIEKSIANGNVEVIETGKINNLKNKGYDVGGFVGYVTDESQLTISESMAMGNSVTTKLNSGGFIGSTYGDILNIDKCVAFGNTVAYSNAGSFIGNIYVYYHIDPEPSITISNSFGLGYNLMDDEEYYNSIGYYEFIDIVVGRNTNITSVFFPNSFYYLTDSASNSCLMIADEIKYFNTCKNGIIFKDNPKTPYLRDKSTKLLDKINGNDDAWVEMSCKNKNGETYTTPVPKSLVNNDNNFLDGICTAM